MLQFHSIKGSILYCLTVFTECYFSWHPESTKMEFENLYGPAAKYDCLLFDLDDTLYPLSSGLAKEVLKNIHEYMVEKLGIDRSKINDLSNLLYKNYGTTMAGLRAIGYDFDYDEYHSFVHGRLPYDNLKPDPILRNILLSIPIRKVIFTNADKIHAAKALSKLGLEDCFEGIICFETLNPTHKIVASEDEDDVVFVGSRPPLIASATKNNQTFDIISHFASNNDAMTLPKTPVICKPSEYAMEQALKIANLNPQKTIFLDDSVRNVLAGKRVGMDTVVVGTSHRPKGADYALESIHNLKEALPQLWDSDVRVEVNYSDNFSRETPVVV
ncbi:hypothetical protein RND81_13G081300 [Saponaria officinalis]|uniref:Uncharacterized protein n=1 Tax=Saponaria officinalis TaxID=3572 RepID=A0AAW1GYW1_SAPOF